MTELVKAPDLAAEVITYLNAAVTPPISSRVPNPRPDTFGRLTQVPSLGFQGEALFHGRVVFEAWALSEPAAFDLAADCDALLRAATDWEVVTDGVGQFPPDPLTGTPKFGFTADIYTSGDVTQT
jgi:hypothetical protein